MSSRALSRDIAREMHKAGIDDAAFEAELLTRWAAGLTRAQFLANPGIEDHAVLRARAMAARRLQHEPSTYITGTREFYGRPFAVTPAVLIPRPETELLVELALEELLALPAATVVDVGTGSGCVAVSIAVERRQPGVTIGVDVSRDALEVAAPNAAKHEADVSLLQGDLVIALRSVDVIVANLPYIPSSDIPGLQPEVRDWEPRRALDGGPDGLTLVRRLVHDCGARVRPRLLAMEIGIGQARAVVSLCVAAGAADVRTHRDLSGIERVVTARWA